MTLSRLFLWPVQKDELKKFICLTVFLFSGYHAVHVMHTAARTHMMLFPDALSVSYESAFTFGGWLALVLAILYVPFASCMRMTRISMMYIVALMLVTVSYFFLNLMSLFAFTVVVLAFKYLIPTFLFWQVINAMTSKEQSSRFYILLSLVAVGLLHPLFTQVDFSMMKLASLTRFAGYGLGMLTLSFMSLFLLERCFEGEKNQPVSGSIAKALSSPFIWKISAMSFFAIMATALYSMAWKVGRGYEFMSEMASEMGEAFMYASVLGLVLIFVFKNIVSWWGWKKAAMLPPVVALIGAGFFALLLSKGAQNVLLFTFAWGLTTATAMSLFIPMREMLYVPLENVLRVKGKVIVDIVSIITGMVTATIIAVLTVIVLSGSIEVGSVEHTYALVILGAVSTVLWMIFTYVVGKEYESNTKNAL